VNGWVLYEGSDTNWEKQVVEVEGSTYLHDNRWANNLNSLGWEVCRWNYKQGDESIAFLQGFLKHYPLGIGVLWFPDWIVGDYELGRDMTSFLKKSLSLRFLIVRMRSHHQNNNQELAILKQSFRCALNPFDSGMTMHLDLSVSPEKLHQGLSKNWKRNLKRSKRLSYEVIEIKDADTVVRLYSEMGEVKKMKEFFSRRQITSLMDSYKDKLIIIGARTPDGKVQAIRGAIIRGGQAIDIFAAANAFSRKNYLTYGLCWELVNRCKSLECDCYDFNGVDPENNIGVYNFKKGTGANLVKTLGEFEWSNSNFLNFVINRFSHR